MAGAHRGRRRPARSAAAGRRSAVELRRRRPLLLPGPGRVRAHGRRARPRRAVAVRPGAGRDPRERAPDGGPRLPHLALQVRGLRPGRAVRRGRRKPVRLLQRLREPRLPEHRAVGDGADHGDPRRGRLPAGAGRRQRGHRAPRERHQRPHRALAARPRPRSTSRSPCSRRRASSGCCARAAHSPRAAPGKGRRPPPGTPPRIFGEGAVARLCWAPRWADRPGDRPEPGGQDHVPRLEARARPRPRRRRSADLLRLAPHHRRPGGWCPRADGDGQGWRRSDSSSSGTASASSRSAGSWTTR